MLQGFKDKGVGLRYCEQAGVGDPKGFMARVTENQMEKNLDIKWALGVYFDLFLVIRGFW